MSATIQNNNRERYKKEWGNIHVFNPVMSSYLPLGSYPSVTTGGMVLQASQVMVAL